MLNVKKIMLSLMDHVNLKDYQTLASYLGVTRETVYGWIKRNKIGNTGKILAKLPYISLKWLETGEGPMMIIDESNIDKLPEGWPIKADRANNQKISAKIEPGNDRQRQRLQKNNTERKQENGQEDKKNTEDWSMSEMLVMTTTVLESDTVYRSALASNIRAFHKAVNMEKEMNEVRQEIASMRKENHDMVERMARMEEMLLSLGEVFLKKETPRTANLVVIHGGLSPKCAEL